MKYFYFCALLALTGCSSLEQIPDFSQFGAADPTAEAKVLDNYNLEKKKRPSSQDVMVLIDTVPEGIDVNDNQISTASGYNHKVIGRFTLAPDYKNDFMNSLGRFPDYESNGIKWLCYPQVPLYYVTFSLWSIVPLSYPCYGSIKSSKETILDKAKIMTASAGGDLAVVSYLKGDGAETVGALGYVIKLDPRSNKQNLKTKKATLQKEKNI